MRSINISLPSVRRVLDFGCGTGWVSAEAAMSGSPFCVGVDYSVESLQGTGVPPRDFEASRYPVHLVAGSGLNLPFAAGAFDVVVGHVSMPYMNTRKALQEVYRVLAPGGSFLLTFHSLFYLRNTLAASVSSGRWKNVIFMGYLAVNGLLNHFSLPQTPVWWRRSRFETVNSTSGVAKAARRAGFTMITTEFVADRIFFVVTARKPGPDGVFPAPGYAAGCKLKTDAGTMVLSTQK